MKTLKKERNNDYSEKLQQKKQDIARPYLTRRYGYGMLDFLSVILATVVLLIGCYFSLFKWLGYFDSVDACRDILMQSGLYDKNGEVIVMVDYDPAGSLSAQQVYEERIISYYSSDERAVKENKLDWYYSEKAKLTDDEQQGSAFYQQQYNQAIEFLYQNEDYIYHNNHSYQIFITFLFICFLMAGMIFYVVIPLTNCEGETLFMKLGKMCLLDSVSLQKVNKRQVVLRGLAFVVINFGLTILIYQATNVFMSFFALINMTIMSFTKYNQGIHGLVSHTYVIMKARADAMDTLKKVVGG